MVRIDSALVVVFDVVGRVVLLQELHVCYGLVLAICQVHVCGHTSNPSIKLTSEILKVYFMEEL